MAVSKALAKRAPAKKATRQAAAKKPTASRAPAVIAEADYTITEIPTVEQVKTALAEGVKFYFDGESDTGSFLATTLERASTPDDLFAESELVKIKEHLGETFDLMGIDAVRNSDFNEEGGLGIYLIVSAVDSEGELVKLGVGQVDPLGKIVALHEMNAFPWRVSFEKSEKQTKRGFFPINLVNRQARTKSGAKTDF